MAIPSQDEVLEQAAAFAKEHGPMLDLQQVIADQAPRVANWSISPLRQREPMYQSKIQSINNHNRSINSKHSMQL